jgi:sugar phosphate isomerase/epimerase
MKKILIQPSKSNFSEYTKFATNHNFQFEIIDFAFADLLDIKNDKLATIEFYKNKIRNGENKIISIHGAFLDLYLNSPDKKIKKVAEQRIIENLRIADELNIKHTVFHTNSLPMMGNSFYYKNWITTQVNFWKKHLPKYKTTVLLENMWDKTPNLLDEVLNKVNSKKLKVCFDTGHCNVFSNVKMENWFKTLRNKITYIHINDNAGDMDSELPPGMGTIDWIKLNALIEKYCEDPILVLELKNLDYLNQGIDYLTKHTTILNK